MNSLATSATTKAQPTTVALFVSDLHLSPDTPNTLAAFFAFLQNQAVHATQLYVLGDLFEYWPGDDDVDSPFPQQVCQELKRVSDQGAKIFWLSGNRDFLVGSAFAAATGLTLLNEPHIVEIGDKKILLVHGDAQCTDDTAYMVFRTQVRNPEWQAAFLARPLSERKSIIAGMREDSRAAQKEKSMAIMDVNPAQIAALFKTYAVNLLIHGHTHRPDIHHTPEGVRYVLPDWDCEPSAADKRRGGWLALDSAGELHAIKV
jgi:UDP-2,3-diacylglucosamine hydrolase